MTRGGAPLGFHVSHVVVISADTEVARIDAQWGITLVHHLVPMRDWSAVVQLPGDPVRIVLPAPNGEFAVAGIPTSRLAAANCTLPDPALVIG